MLHLEKEPFPRLGAVLIDDDRPLDRTEPAAVRPFGIVHTFRATSESNPKFAVALSNGFVGAFRQTNAATDALFRNPIRHQSPIF